LTAVAPIVRFNAFDILATPVFFFASDFNSRTSDEVHARRTMFFLAISVPFLRTGLVSRDLHFAMAASHRRLKSWDGCLRFSRWVHLSERTQLTRSEARLSDVQNLLHFAFNTSIA
jgi:hypothetical protein